AVRDEGGVSMKRAVILLFAGSLGLALAACGGGDNTTTFVEGSSAPAATSGSPSASPSATTSGSPVSSSIPTAAPTPLAGNLRIIIDSPDGGSQISSPIDVSGTASVDKGTVVAVVLDGHGTELGRATTTASAVRPDFGHYDVTVSFSGSTSGAKGQIK